MVILLVVVVVWLREGATARWEAIYPFLHVDHEKKEKSAWGQNRLSTSDMIVISLVTASEQKSAVLSAST